MQSLPTAILTLVLASAPRAAQLNFVDSSAGLGLQPYSMAAGLAGGAAAADCDGDGLVDLFVPNGHGVADQFYVNSASLGFVEQAQASGLDSLENDRGALWLDFDGDHDLDLVVASDNYQLEQAEPMHPVRLYEHASALQFGDTTAGSGLEVVELPNPDTHVGGLCAGDVNMDGWLDLCVAYWEGGRYLFVNRNGQGFRDHSRRSGLGEPNSYWQPSFHDFDGDGWLDLFQAVDFTANELWINDQQGRFFDVAPKAGLDNAMNDMGVAFGDYDNDGDHDIYVTNIFGPGEHNIFLHNDSPPGRARFREIAQTLGVDQGYLGWGTCLFDADKDGWLDLAETNGFGTPSRFWFNTGGPQPGFLDASDQVGFNDTFTGSSLMAFDCERDGDLDLLQTCIAGPLRLLTNQPQLDPQGAHWLSVLPRQGGPNQRAIGSELRLRAGELELTSRIHAGTSILGQEPAEAFFGLGDEPVVERVSVRWPDGAITHHGPFAADQLVTIQRP